MNLIDPEKLSRRAVQPGNNGLKFLLVNAPDTANNQVTLELHFYQPLSAAAARSIVSGTREQLHAIFSISGGRRVPAGNLAGGVQVVQALAYSQQKLQVNVSPIGDYSTYTLSMNFPGLDPLLSSIDFKFRPGCFNLNRTPGWQPFGKPPGHPDIDYLAKDFDSFRHTLVTAMMKRVPGWQPTSEADLDMVLVELFSVAADELSDYQDRVMNEAYLTTARKRVSLARHARLMDYHIHQGNQASTYLAVKSNNGDLDIPVQGFLAWTGKPALDTDSQVFVPRQACTIYSSLNQLPLYNWGQAVSGLKAGSTQADLGPLSAAEAQSIASLYQQQLEQKLVPRLLIQEWFDPGTALAVGADPEKRQLLEVVAAQALQDTVNPDALNWFVRIRWQGRDQLRQDYACYCQDQAVVYFHGNLLEVFQGMPKTLIFQEPGTRLATANARYFERTAWGTLCRLDEDDQLAYTQTLPGGETAPVSTLMVLVQEASEPPQIWSEQISLIHSQEDSRDFLVETDELGRSVLRFGLGQNGRALPEGAVVACSYQIGSGLEGNIGQDKLVNCQGPGINHGQQPDLVVWNPFDVTSGRGQESVAEIVRRVPEAYLRKQQRCVTLADYEKKAEELTGDVSRACARYFWAGSWRTVRILIDPVAGGTLTPELQKKIMEHLEPLRLMGEDLEIRAPHYVPLKIKLSLQVDDQYWPEDIQALLEQEFSTGYTSDGRMGFFHPDAWTFGQSLQASQLLGRAQSLQGVDHVVSVELQRFDRMLSGARSAIDIQPDEIVQVENDPDQMEKGYISFELTGGRG